MRLIDADEEIKIKENRLKNTNETIRNFEESRYDILPMYWKERDKELQKFRDERNKLIIEISAIKHSKTAFDLESVITEIEKKRDFCYQQMEKEGKETDYFSEHIFEEYHNQGKAFNEVIKILKSAANATNGKNGG